MIATTFSPGFRLSLLDIGVLVVGALTAWVLAAQMWWLGFIVGFVVAHFFLFCNVFRLGRPLELAWAGVFVALAGGTIVQDAPGWGITAAGSLSATMVVILLEMRKPSYHGVLWRWINPGLPDWWERSRQSTELQERGGVRSSAHAD